MLGLLHQIFAVTQFQSFVTPPNWSQQREEKYGYRVENKSWLLKSALICVSWRGDCLLGPVVTLLYQPVLFASSLSVWRILALPFFASFLWVFFLSHMGMCTNMHANTHICKSICTHFSVTHIFFLSFFAPPFLSVLFFLWLLHTLIPFLQGQASHGTLSE